MRVPAKLHQAIQVLGLMRELHRMAQAKSFQEALQSLEELKQKAKRNFKELSRKHHPDVGGNEETMKELSAAFDFVKKVAIKEPRPQPVFQVVRVNFGGYTTTSWGVHPTTSTGGWYTGGW